MIISAGILPEQTAGTFPKGTGSLDGIHFDDYHHRMIPSPHVDPKGQINNFERKLPLEAHEVMG